EADEEDDFLFDEESSGRGIDIEGLFSTDDDGGEASPGMFPRGGADDFGLSEDVDPFADLLDDDSPRAKRARRGGRGRIFVRLLVLILVVVLLGVLVLVFLGGGDESDGGDTPVEAVVVAAADVNVDAAGTLEDVRQAAESEARISGLGNDAVAEFEKQGDGFALVIRFCTQPTPQLQQLVMNAMELIARRVGTTPAIQEFLAGVGINAQDCARNNDILFRASSPMAAVVALTNNPGTGGDSLAVFRQSWTVEN
ncbi:MAG TPA: hypothetical protein VJZ27_07825, partial [Aggregatilineales bacterium]|nr:hypothetical protein [Aggregatilineales bacterium]